MPLGGLAKAALDCVGPVTFDYDGDWFYISDPALGFVRRQTPADFFKSVANAVECSRKHRPWDRPVAEIINLADHAASVSGKPSK